MTLRVRSTAALLLLFAWPTLAAEEQARLKVEAAACRLIVRHQPAPDVAYRPGVDGAGLPVAPADLDADKPNFNEPLLVEITIDLFKQFGIPPDGAADYRGRAIIGTVAATADGRVTLNGRPLSFEGERALAASCARGR